MTQPPAGPMTQPPMSPDTTVRTVAVIGAGTAGRSFALAVACAGFHVVLEDVMPANLRKAKADFADMGHRAEAALRQGRLSLALTVEDAVREADLAIDFVPDELESKLEIFSMIDRMAPPRTILCTPSYALSITDLASCVYRPERSFALRGALISPSDLPLRVLHTASVDTAALGATVGFLKAVGLLAQTEIDPDAPMLLKNLALPILTDLV